jgi:hypothetical protein
MPGQPFLGQGYRFLGFTGIPQGSGDIIDAPGRRSALWASPPGRQCSPATAGPAVTIVGLHAPAREPRLPSVGRR